ncbi:MAG: hypothetical protein CMJ72_06040 [Planctomycetaceae bacterium]|nr:hypothetical protein [Planctomycetaceae bacterium]HCK40202.1 hypothetical protein [Planctomycetaceae bacterium]
MLNSKSAWPSMVTGGKLRFGLAGRGGCGVAMIFPPQFLGLDPAGSKKMDRGDGFCYARHIGSVRGSCRFRKQMVVFNPV